MFDKKWFKDNQRILLWLLNSPLTRRVFRYKMRIYCDEEINQITPNSYTFGGKLILDNGKLKAQFKTDFRTHNKYSKCLYYGFLPIWKILHTWDTLVANKLNTNWNLGFDTTYYPDPASGATTVDGYATHQQSDASWATIRGGAGTGADTTGNLLIQYSVHADAATYDMLSRVILTFDASGIGSGVISAATLSIKGTSKANPTSATWDLNVYSATPAANNNIANGDYTTLGTTPYSSTIAYADFSTSAYNDFALNATWLAAISGISKFGLRNATHDVGNSAPSVAPFGASTNLQALSADTALTTSDPKLVVTWAVTITPSNATITLSGQVPTVVAVITVSPSNATITLTGQVPTITKTGGFDYPSKNTAVWTHQTKN